MSQIFICYAHDDNNNPDPSKRWLDRLLKQLKPLQLRDQADIWSDKRIELGENWHDEIQITLKQVSIAVLLVSDSFLASEYIFKSELPVLLYKAKAEGVTILPVILRQCMWKETKFKYPDPKTGPEELSLSSIQVPNTKPLNALPEHEQDDVLYKIAQKIYKIINNPKPKPSPPLEPENTPSLQVNMNLSTTERLELMRTLNSIMPEQLDMIIFTLTPPPGVIPPLPAAQGQRVSALLQWADRPTGCGLTQLQQTLGEVLNPL